jgi:hypothetical protein
MNYKTWPVLLCLLASVLAYTSITTANCPAQFNITTANSTTDTTVASLGALVYGAFQSPSSQAKVNSIVVNGDYNALTSYMSEMMVPYIILAVIFIAFYLFIVACCLFDRSCPPCDSLRRNLEQDPYSKR